MADVSKRLAKGVNSGGSKTIYTVPVGKRTFVKALTICSTKNEDTTITLEFAYIPVIFSHKLKVFDTLTIPFLDQILEAGETIAFSVGATGSVAYYISGREVDV